MTPSNSGAPPSALLAAAVLGLWLPIAAAQVGVRTAPLGDVLEPMVRRAPAEVLPLNRSVVAAEITGVVAAVHHDVGAVVPAGATLVELDPADYRLGLQRAEAELAAARAQLAQAEARLSRARALGENQYLSPDDLLGRETELEVAQANIAGLEASVAIARRNLDKTRLSVPFRSAVDERHAQVGSLATPGQPLVEVTEVDRFEVAAELPARDAASIDRARSIRFESPGGSWPLTLLRRSPVVDPARRSVAARFAFVDDAPPVGSAGEVAWELAAGAIPAALVVRRDGRLGVFLDDNGNARFHVLPLAQEGRPVPIEEAAGLGRGAAIIIDGRTRLQDGDPVTRDG